MSEDKEIWYAYEGNRFCLERTGSGSSGWVSYAVRGIVLGNACLRLPDAYEGRPVSNFPMREQNPGERKIRKPWILCTAVWESYSQGMRECRISNIKRLPGETGFIIWEMPFSLCIRR